MSKSNIGVNAIYNGGLTQGYTPQAGGNVGRSVINGLDSTAKKIGFFRNIVKPIADNLGLQSQVINNLVNKGYGKKKRTKKRKYKK